MENSEKTPRQKRTPTLRNGDLTLATGRTLSDGTACAWCGKECGTVKALFKHYKTAHGGFFIGK